MANPQTTARFMILAAVLAAALPLLSSQQPSPSPISPGPTAPSPALDCMPYLLNLSDCLTFVETGSNLTKPEPGCCPELANLVGTQPICLCQLLGNPGQTGFTFDSGKALKLPAVCNVTTPPVSLCAAVGVPVGAFAGGDAPASSPSPSDGGSIGLGPGAPGGGSSGGPMDLACTHRFLIGLGFVFFMGFF